MATEENQPQQRMAWLAGALLTALAGMACVYYSLGDGLARASYDQRQDSRRSNPPGLMMVYTGPQTLALGRTAGGMLPRRFLAQLVERLIEARASLVVFDLLFPEAGEDSTGDEELAAAIRRHGSVILAAEYVQESYSESASDFTAAKGQVIPPLPLLEEAAAGWGIASIVRDSDGVVRRLYAGRDPEPSLAWAAARLLGAPVTTHRHVDFNGAWLNYYGPPLETFPSCNVEDVLRADGIPLERFRGKIVVVGGLPAAGVPGAGRDEFSTPYSRGRASGMAPGAEIHAVTLMNLLGNDWLTRMDLRAELAIVGLWGALIGAVLMFFRPPFAALVAAAAALGVLLVAPQVGRYSSGGFWWSWRVLWMVQVPVALVWSVGFQYAGEAVRRWRLRAVVMDESLAVQIEEGKLPAAPGGVERDVTVMFTDIEGYAKMAEHLAPTELTEVLRIYFNELAGQVTASGGTVIRYMGDGMMAAWGATKPCPDHAVQAVRAAWRMSQAGRRELAGRRMRTRFGINSGVGLCGHVGADKHFDYSVIGATTNLAARLEQLNKRLGTELLVSGETESRLGGKGQVRRLGRWRIRGLDQVIALFEVLGVEDAPGVRPVWLEAFETGLEAWEKGDAIRAKEFFERANSSRDDGDESSQFFLKRLPPEHGAEMPWDGVVDASAE